MTLDSLSKVLVALVDKHVDFVVFGAIAKCRTVEEASRQREEWER